MSTEATREISKAEATERFADLNEELFSLQDRM